MTKVEDWKKEVIEKEGVSEGLLMDAYPIVKVYNKPMGNNSVEDVTKAGKILIKRGGGEFEVLSDELNLNVLRVVKFYTGFVPRVNEFGDVVQDDKGRAIKDFYFTPEVDVFSKANIPLGKQVKGGDREIVGRGDKMEFDKFCKEPKIDGKINPLFNEIKTNQQTGEKYSTTYMKLGYAVYVQDNDTKEIYKVIPGGSYGRWNDVQNGTFEDLKVKAGKAHVEQYAEKLVLSFINAKVGVRAEGGFYYLDWNLDSFITKDNTGVIADVDKSIEEFNTVRFKGIDFNMPNQALPYGSGLAIEQNSSASNSTNEIDIQDVPF